MVKNGVMNGFRRCIMYYILNMGMLLIICMYDYPILFEISCFIVDTTFQKFDSCVNDHDPECVYIEGMRRHDMAQLTEFFCGQRLYCR